MRYFNSMFVSTFAMVWSFSAQGREARLLEFSNKPAAVISAAGANIFGDEEENDSVAQSMRAHFEQNRIVADIQGGTSFGFDVVYLPTRRLVIPRWMRNRRAPSLSIPRLPLGFRSDLTRGAFEHCDGARYVPTWWLSRDVESRRALHYGNIAAIACEYGIPTTLLDAVIAQESGYKFWAISSAGAMGLMQIMPTTARLLGLALPFDPIANVRAGARYLRQQLDRFGRIDLALAAYNAGPERRSLRKGYIPAIPETLNYIRTIQTNWARLSPVETEVTSSAARGAAAAAAVRASGYRTVEMVSYDGRNAPNPM